MTRNELFYKVMVGMFIIVLLTGLGAMVAVLWVENETIVIRLIGTFTGVLTGVIGFASGYLLGRNGNGNGNSKGKA